MSVIVLIWDWIIGNFGIKSILSQNWRACVNPKFWQDKELPVDPLCGREERPDSGSTK